MSGKAEAYAAAARAIIARAKREPKRVYLGGGIWWTPSLSFRQSRLGRRLS
jgi:hypothetical protein